MSASVRDRQLQESTQLLPGLMPALLCPPDAGFLPSPWWYQVVDLLLLVPGDTSISDFRALCPNFSSPGLLKYFVYLAAVVPIVPKLFFLLNYRGFKLE